MMIYWIISLAAVSLLAAASTLTVGALVYALAAKD